MQHVFAASVTKQQDGSLCAMLSVPGADFAVVATTPADLQAALLRKVQGYYDTLEQKRRDAVADTARALNVTVEVYNFPTS